MAQKIARSDIENAISQILFCCAPLDFTFDTTSFAPEAEFEPADV